MTADDIAEMAQETRARRDAALRSFWSDDPLNLTYRKTGRETFTLKAFIAFVAAMPRDQFEACTRSPQRRSPCRDYNARSRFPHRSS